MMKISKKKDVSWLSAYCKNAFMFKRETLNALLQINVSVKK
ncbi:MAG: hypothetical protein ACTSXH_16145 [Promethearchaeota archaeon]